MLRPAKAGERHDKMLDPTTQRVVRDAELLGDVCDAPVRRGADQADGFSFEPYRVWCAGGVEFASVSEDRGWLPFERRFWMAA